MENNYGDIAKEYCNKEKSKIVILPVPYDNTSTWIKGADKGPQAIIDASGNMELYDIETKSEVYKQGMFTEAPLKVKNISPEQLAKEVETRISGWIAQKKFTVVLGGEHSVSIGAIQAHAKAHAKKTEDFCVLQLDAHADTREEYHDSKYNHACVMARARELCPIVQVGIRSMDVSEKEKMDLSRVFFAEKISKDRKENREGKESRWMKEVVSKLSSNVYLTIDLDVFDPSIMPSTGTPEPGGLSWYEVLDLLKMVVEQKKLVGLDVVELCPNENNKAPDFLAAKLIYKILSYKFKE